MSSVIKTKKQNIPHLQNMPDNAFRFWIKKVKSESNGILRNIKCVMKVDGLSAKFGKDSEGNIFLEGARTGPIFDPEAFGIYARSKTDNPKIIARSDHYGDILRLLQSRYFIKDLPNDIKVYCEILYTPLAKESGDKIFFVSVGYDKRRLGSLMTILPYDVFQASTGLEHEDKKDILYHFYKTYSTPEIKFIDPTLLFADIDISEFIDLLENDNFSREQKESFALYLLYHPNIIRKYDLGDEIEGIVLHIEGRPYKIVTPRFRAIHRKQN